MAVTSVDERVSALRTSVDQLTRQRARQEAERDAAQVRLDQVSAQLQEQFGVATPDEAKAELLRLQTELNNSVVQIEAALGRTQ